MYQFNYHKPATLDEAAMLYNDADDPIYLSGGQTLIPTMKQRLAAPTDVIDLAAIDGLGGIAVGGGVVKIGAFTRHAEVAASDEVRSAIAALGGLSATRSSTTKWEPTFHLGLVGPLLPSVLRRRIA